VGPGPQVGGQRFGTVSYILVSPMCDPTSPSQMSEFESDFEKTGQKEFREIQCGGGDMSDLIFLDFPAFLFKLFPGDALSCKSCFAKEQVMIGLFCGNDISR